MQQRPKPLSTKKGNRFQGLAYFVSLISHALVEIGQPFPSLAESIKQSAQHMTEQLFIHSKVLNVMLSSDMALFWSLQQALDIY